MGRGSSTSNIAGLAGLVALASAALPAIADDTLPAPCVLEPGPVRTVARVLDGETLVLDDGSGVRLIGALAPRARDAGAQAGAWPPETQAMQTLSNLVLGKRIKLAFGGRQKDRYGRFLAQVFLEANGRSEWVQGTMLAAGQARAYGVPESFACVRELLAHEAEARRKRLGLWSNGVYRPMPAEQPGSLLKQRGKFERVIGTIASVGKTKSTTYLNFGTDWKSDFTVRIGKSVLAANPEFARTLDTLKSKTVVVRGWIERRNGPLIDIADVSQIEIVDGKDDAPGAAGVSAVTAPNDAQPASAPVDPGGAQKLRPDPTEGADPGAVNL
ncbi:MAG: thermonuclease family protein [Hyphomicrobium denitrificans]|nr:thermonuclease family protein [Hyphomicrobium denitrificans]